MDNRKGINRVSRDNKNGRLIMVNHNISKNQRLKASVRILSMWIIKLSFVAGLLCTLCSIVKQTATSSSQQLWSMRNDYATETHAIDVAVVGAGPAGLTASLFAARAGLTAVVFGSSVGQLSEATDLDNFPGFSGSHGGQEWLTVTRQQAAEAGVRFAQAGLVVDRVTKQSDGLFFLELLSPPLLSLQARSVIVATGASARRLEIVGEDALWGKHVHSCAICDGSSYKDRTVVVVGGGDAAVDAAILLSRHAKRVILIHRRSSFRASNKRNLEILQKECSNVIIKTPFVLEQYSVNERLKLEGVMVKNLDSGDTDLLSCNGVFVMIGSRPNTSFLSKGLSIELDGQGLIRLQDGSASSSVPGLFAAGEVTDNIYKQALTAASAGAKAAIDAERWLRQHGFISRDIPDNIPQQPIQKVRVSSQTYENDMYIEDCDLTDEKCIQALVYKYPVVVFSRPWCPYCIKALEALSMLGVTREPFLRVVTLNGDDPKISKTQGRQIQTLLGELTGGRSTVPNVFIGGVSIGGGDETIALHQNGRLRKLLEEAHAYPPRGPCELAHQECINATIQMYPVVVFTKNYCSACKRAIEILQLHGVKNKSLQIIDLMQYENFGEIQDTLERMTTIRTVPNIFVGGLHIGGLADFQAVLSQPSFRYDLKQAIKADEEK